MARLILQPIEESCRITFGRMLNSGSKEDMLSVQQLIVRLLRAYAIISIIAIGILSQYAELALFIVAGSRYSGKGSSTLFIYAIYLPIMAVNGIAEAFVASAASNKDIVYQSRFMIATSILFCSTGWYFLTQLHMGPEGLVIANCVNLLGRALWSVSFITKWYNKHNIRIRWKDALPTWTSITLLVATLFTSHQSVELYTSGALSYIPKSVLTLHPILPRLTQAAVVSVPFCLSM